MSNTSAEIQALQADEIEALAAIYGPDWKIENENGNIFSIIIMGEDRERVIKLQVTFSPGYPLIEPPYYEISAPWLKREEKVSLCNSLEVIYSDHLGESVIFLWIGRIKEFIETYMNVKNETEPQSSNLISEISTDMDTLSIEDNLSNDLIPIYHGEPVRDRKSTFQAHLALVISVEQVKEIMKRLSDNRKIASATHNISAYRIYVESRKTFVQDCDDDGETHAGSRLLHLLQILDVKNVLVVVSRWYGGIQLGPDRFKHINNVARDILKQHSLLPEPSKEESIGGKSRKKKGK